MKHTNGAARIKLVSMIMLRLSIVTIAGCGVVDSDTDAGHFDHSRCRLLSIDGSSTLMSGGDPESQFSLEETCTWTDDTEICVDEDGFETTREYNNFGYVVRYTRGSQSQTYEYDCSGKWCQRLSSSSSMDDDTTDTREITCEWNGNSQSCADGYGTWTRDYNEYGYVVLEVYDSDSYTARSEFTYQCIDGWCGLTSQVRTASDRGQSYLDYERNCSWNDDSQQCSYTDYLTNGDYYEGNYVAEYQCR